MPEILDVTVSYLRGTESFIRVLFDRLPDVTEMVFEERQSIYLATDGDYARIFFYQKPGHGMSGWTFDVTLTDGSKRHIVGPWACNPASCNPVFPGSEIEQVSMTADLDQWEAERTSWYGYVTREGLIRALKSKGYTPALIRNTYGETEFTVLRNPEVVLDNEVQRF